MCLPNKESVSGHRCEGTNMAYRSKIFEVVNLITLCCSTQGTIDKKEQI